MIYGIKFRLAEVEWDDAFSDDVAGSFIHSLKHDRKRLAETVVNTSVGYWAVLGEWNAVIHGGRDGGDLFSATFVPNAMVRKVTLF